MSEPAAAPPSRQLVECVQAIRRDDGTYWPCLVFVSAQELLQHRIHNPSIIPTERGDEYRLAIMDQVLDPTSNGRMALLLGGPTASPLLVWERSSAPLVLQSLDEFLLHNLPLSDDLKVALRIVRSYGNQDPCARVALPVATTGPAEPQRTTLELADEDDDRKMSATTTTVQLPSPVAHTRASTRSAPVQLDTTMDNMAPVDSPMETSDEAPAAATAKTAKVPTQPKKKRGRPPGSERTTTPPKKKTAKKVVPKPKAKAPSSATETTTTTPPPKTPHQASATKAPPPEPPQLYGTDIVFSDVRQIFKKGGYKFQTKMFAIPGQGKFKTEGEFRTHLCRAYVSCKCGGRKNSSGISQPCACWTQAEREQIMNYVRYGMMSDTEYRRARHPPELVPSGMELCHLLERMGVQVENYSRYTFPGEHTEVGWQGVLPLDRPLELKNQVARFQWPSCCDRSKISEKELFDLEYTIVQECLVDTFSKPEPQLSRKARREHQAQVAKASPPSVTKRPIRTPKKSNKKSPKKAAVTKSNKKTPRKAAVTKSTKKTLARKTRTSEPDDATVISCDASAKSSLSARVNTRSEEADVYTASPQSSPTASHSPLAVQRSTVTSVSPPGPFASRISIAPRDFAPTLRPVYTGTDCEKLRSCLDALSISNNSDSPSFSWNETSQFKTNMKKIHDFLQTTIGGKTSDEPFTQSSALYVCGVPGIGKTSGVRWCCNLTRNGAAEMDVVVCEINAASLVSHSKPIENINSAIGTSLGLKSGTVAAIERKLRYNDSKWNSTFLIVVVDEVESLVASDKLCGALQSLSEMSNAPHLQMAMIGISNCMNDDKYDLIREHCKFQETITFRAYSESEIRDILYARVGDNLICKPAVTFIAKKVSEGGGGDARRALEMAAYAVQLRLDQTEEDSVSSEALVTFGDAMQANRASEGMQIGERVASLPPTGLAVLCVLVEFASAGFQKTTIVDARTSSNECLREARQSDDILAGPDFMLTLEMIVDMGLLGASRGDKPSEINFTSREVSSVLQEEIYLQTPLEEVSKILDTEVKLPFFQTVRHHARMLAIRKKQQSK